MTKYDDLNLNQPKIVGKVRKQQYPNLKHSFCFSQHDQRWWHDCQEILHIWKREMAGLVLFLTKCSIRKNETHDKHVHTWYMWNEQNKILWTINHQHLRHLTWASQPISSRILRYHKGLAKTKWVKCGLHVFINKYT